MSIRVLLDTCVISELRKKNPSVQVIKAFSQIDAQDMFLSAVSLGEIAKGIHLLDEGTRKQELWDWLESLKKDYQTQTLGIDIDIAMLWGEITAKAQKKGRSISTCDGLIAATAKRWDLQVMTRNIADFEPTQVELINPWE